MDTYGNRFYLEMFCRKAVAKISQNLQKNICASIFILTLEALGKEEFKGSSTCAVKIFFYYAGSSMESVPNAFSYVYQKFSKIPDLWRQKTNKNNSKN